VESARVELDQLRLSRHYEAEQHRRTPAAALTACLLCRRSLGEVRDHAPGNLHAASDDVQRAESIFLVHRTNDLVRPLPEPDAARGGRHHRADNLQLQRTGIFHREGAGNGAVRQRAVGPEHNPVGAQDTHYERHGLSR